MTKARIRMLAALYTVIFILAGAAAIILTEGYGWRLDLTENRLYTLSEASEMVVSEISGLTTVTVFNQESECPIILRKQLLQYAKRNRHLSVFYCDPYREPDRIRHYEELGYRIELNDLMIESGSKCKQIKLTDMYEMNEEGTQIKRVMAEQLITSGIHQVNTGEKEKVLFTDGHGEEPSQALMELFSMNSYETGYTELSVLGVDEQTEILVICAPKRDFSTEEVALIEAYLTSGGSLMVFLEPGAENLGNLKTLLNDWGLDFAGQAVMEPKLFVSGSGLNIAATYAPHAINQFFTNNRYYVIIPSCAALKQAYIRQGTTKTQQVLYTSPDAYMEGSFDKGVFGLALTSQRAITLENGQAAEGRIFLSGSKQIYGDDLLSSAKLANRDFLVQTAAWCAGDHSLISIPAKETDSMFLPVTAWEVRILSIFMLGVLPGGILAGGAFVSLRRRYL